MKKTCYGCRALEDWGKKAGLVCGLGFQIEKTYNKDIPYPVSTVKPVEQCPKPKTNKEYLYLYNMKIQGKPI